MHQSTKTRKKLNRRYILKRALFVLATLVAIGIMSIANPFILSEGRDSVVSVTTRSLEIDEATPKRKIAATNVKAAELSEEALDEAAEESTPETPTTEESIQEEYIILTDSEKKMIASLVYLEARGESLECQEAVASVIINRFTTGDCNSIEDVIYAKRQFTPAKYVSSTTPTKTQLDIVEKIALTGPTIPEYVTYFRARYYHNWGGLHNYCYYSNTYFSYDQEVYNQVMN